MIKANLVFQASMSYCSGKHTLPVPTAARYEAAFIAPSYSPGMSSPTVT